MLAGMYVSVNLVRERAEADLHLWWDLASLIPHGGPEGGCACDPRGVGGGIEAVLLGAGAFVPLV